MTGSAARLAHAGERDPEVAPLARLLAEAHKAAGEPAWVGAASGLDLAAAPAEVPVLHHHFISVDPGLARALVARLAAVSGLEDGVAELDPVALLEASVVQRAEEIEALAEVAQVDPDQLLVIGQVATIPLLTPLGERAAEIVAARNWEPGYCPVCAAWPLLAELRGIDRTRVLRCGRCTSAWPFSHGRCPYCGNDDHRDLGYLSPEDLREGRRSYTCSRCHGYLKAIGVLKPLDAADLAIADLTSIELDIAALDRGFGRPESTGFPLDLSLTAAEPMRA